MSRLFALVAVAVAIYVVLAILGGWQSFQEGLRRFPPILVAPLLLLSLLNYALRYWRWSLYLSHLRISLRTADSAILFFATFLMVITPGKLGEAFKAGILWEKHQVPLAQGLPIVVAERLQDIVAILVLACFGWVFWHGPSSHLGTGLLVTALLPLSLVVFRTQRAQQWLLRRAGSASSLRRYGLHVSEALAALHRLMTGRVALLALVLSVAAWTCECLSLWMVCRALGLGISPLAAIFIYAAGTLVGSLILVPGGLGGTEGTIIWLLKSREVSEGSAVAVTLIVRMATLWLAVSLGLIVFLLAGKTLRGSGATPVEPS